MFWFVFSFHKVGKMHEKRCNRNRLIKLDGVTTDDE